MIRLLMKFARGAGFALVVLLTVLCLYIGAAVWSAALPERSRASPPAQGTVAIALCHDVIHTDFAVPIAHVRAALPTIAAELPEGLPDNTQILIGWGDYEFFTKVTTLDELQVSVAATALLGQNPAAVRVQWTTQDYVAGACTALAMSDDGRTALDAFIAATLIPNTAPLPRGRYGEAYLPAHGRYSPLHTCNQWTSRALKQAGLPRARFAPFSFGVLWPLKIEAEQMNDNATLP